jgi:enediyne biosynthesis protein E5
VSKPGSTRNNPPDLRLPALRRFAIAITVVNLLGHTILGFEPSWAQMFTSLFTAYGLDLLLEWMQARVEGRVPRFRGSLVDLVNFLLPAHITGLAIGMLLYANDRLLPFAFAAAAAIGSKALLTAPVGKGHRHYMNPSNFGLAAALLLLPDIVAIAVPYQFTADLMGFGDWLLPLIVICTGSFLNTFFTRRIPLVLAWVGGFALQAVVRHFLTGAALVPALAPLSGMAVLLFTFYMVPDPGTTPSRPSRQVLFGASVAALYGVFVALHITFAPFFALCLVCGVRGIALHVAAHRDARARATVPVTAPHPARRTPRELPVTVASASTTDETAPS